MPSAPPSRVAADMAAITARFNAKRVVFGVEEVSAQISERDVEFTGDGGPVLRRMTFLRVAYRDLATAVIGNTLTIDGVSYRVHDNRLIAGGALRELWVARA